MTNVDVYILEKIENDPKTFYSHTIKELAKLYHVGSTSIIRLTQKLNFKSFKEMQMHYFLQNKYKSMIDVEPIVDRLDTEGIIENIFKKMLYTIFKTEETGYDCLFKIVNLIKSHEKIILFGVGNSGILADMLSKSLNKIGFNTYKFISIRELLISLQYVNPEKTLYIFYTSSCTSKEVVYISDILSAKNIKFVLVTSSNAKFKNNSLNNAVEKYIYEVNEYESHAFSTLGNPTGQLLFNSLVLAILFSQIEDNEKIQLSIDSELKKWNTT